MDDVDYSALLGGDAASSGQQAQALARAISRRRALGALGTITGDPAMMAVGKELTNEGNVGEQNLIGSVRERPKYAMEQEAVRQQGEARNPLSPISNVTRQLASQLGLDVTPETPAAGLEGVLPTAVKAGEVPRYQPLNNMWGVPTRLLNIRTGETKPIVSGGGGGGGHGGMLDDKTIDMLADNFAKTGQLPQMGMGKAGALLKTEIMRRAANRGAESPDLAGSSAEYKANRASLQKLQTQADAMDAFENTALGNLHRFLDTARTTIPSGSPLWNAPAEAFMQQVAGDPRMAAMNAARQTAVQEISKVLGGSTGQNAVSDSARTEASELLPKNASFAQIEAAANILEKDMQTRKTAVHGQLADIHGRLGGKAKTEPTAEPSGVRKFVRGPDGKLTEVSK